MVVQEGHGRESLEWEADGGPASKDGLPRGTASVCREFLPTRRGSQSGEKGGEGVSQANPAAHVVTSHMEAVEQITTRKTNVKN